MARYNFQVEVNALEPGRLLDLWERVRPLLPITGAMPAPKKTTKKHIFCAVRDVDINAFVLTLAQWQQDECARPPAEQDIVVAAAPLQLCWVDEDALPVDTVDRQASQFDYAGGIAVITGGVISAYTLRELLHLLTIEAKRAVPRPPEE